MKKWLPLLLIAFLFFQLDAEAQCSMCKAVAESDLEGGGSTARGLNDGILYLMAFPYLLIGTVGFFWYRHKKGMGS
jgi:hypothetical protein